MVFGLLSVSRAVDGAFVFHGKTRHHHQPDTQPPPQMAHRFVEVHDVIEDRDANVCRFISRTRNMLLFHRFPVSGRPKDLKHGEIPL